MRLATRTGTSPDGELVVVSDDGTRAIAAGPRWPTLLAAIGDWAAAEPELRVLAAAVENAGEALDPKTLRAPCPGRGSGSTGRRSRPTAS